MNEIVDRFTALVISLQEDIDKTQNREAYLRANQRALEANRILTELLNLDSSDTI